MKKIEVTLLFVILNLVQYPGLTWGQEPDWLWAKSAGGGLGDGTKSIAVDEIGNVYAIGSFRSSSITFGTSTFQNAGYYDIFIVKYDPDGNVLWAKSAGGINDDYIHTIALDISGNIYIGGTSSSPSITFGTTTLTNSGGFLVKYNPDGDEQFVRQYTGASVFDVFVDVTGKIYVGGSFGASSITFGSTTLYNAGDGFADIYVLKLDANANVIWASGAGGHYSEVIISLTVDASENIFITGYFQSTPMIIGAFNLFNSLGSTQDIYFAKLDIDGNFSWANAVGGNGSEKSNSIGIDPSGNIIMTGYFTDTTITFDSFVLTNDTTDNTADMFIAKYDSSGNSIWATSFGGKEYDEATCVAIDISGNIYVSGYFESPFILFGSDSITNSGLLIVKYDNNGNFIWAKTADTSGYHKAFTVAVNQSGDLYVGGDFFTFSLYLDSIILTNESTSGGGTIADMYVAKLDSIQTIGVSSQPIKGNFPVVIYPNPASSNITVQVSDNSHWSLVTIYNIQGEHIFTSTFNIQHPIFDISSFAPGLYYLALQSDQGVATKKFEVIR